MLVWLLLSPPGGRAMKKKRRSWIKKSGIILSTVVSLTASAGKVEAEVSAKSLKPNKKNKPSALHASDDDEAGDGRPPKDAVAAGKPPPPDPIILPARLSDLHKQQFVMPEQPVLRLPWRRGIVTTVFWIGEKPSGRNTVPNHHSSWDPQWMKHYGGFDDPDPKARKGYLPAGFIPKQNPFYVALPYNDFVRGGGGHKDEARKCIPWFEKEYDGPDHSVCKGRWLAIRKGNRVCYAQWEDAGPFTTDDADYVFGTAQPKLNANKGAGLDVSPAVRDFLGLDSTDVTDWRFIEFEDVPVGPWAEHGDNNHFVINRRKSEKKESVAESDSKPSSTMPPSRSS
jgi:hypothetical protein